VRTRICMQDILRTAQLRQLPCAGNMVGMEVRVDRFDEAEIELIHELNVTIDLLQHRVDDQRLRALSAGDQVAVSARYTIE